MDYFDIYGHLYGDLNYVAGDEIDGRVRLCYAKAIVAMGPKTSVKSLDIGCGLGASVDNFSKMGFHACGIDPASSAVVRCVEKGLNCVRGSVTQMPYVDGEFDLITCTDVLEHVDPSDVDMALGEIVRIMGPNAILYVRIALIPETGESLDLYDLKQFGIKLNNLHVSLFPAKEWIGRLEEHGLNVVEVVDDRANWVDLILRKPSIQA